MDDYDVVLDALQKHRDKLWEMIDRNMSSGYMALNIMDDIRFYQIEQLDEAIMARKNAIDKSLNGEEHMTTTVTLNAMQDRIKKVSYHLMPGTTTTFCQVDMINGYTVWGMSACVDPSKYNQSLGEKYSYEDAMNKLWPLEGYLLAEEIYAKEKNT